MVLKASVKGLYNLGQLGASNAIKSNFAKKKVEWLINILVKPLIDSFTSDVSNKLDPSHHGGQIGFYNGIQ